MFYTGKVFLLRRSLARIQRGKEMIYDRITQVNFFYFEFNIEYVVWVYEHFLFQKRNSPLSIGAQLSYHTKRHEEKSITYNSSKLMHNRTMNVLHPAVVYILTFICYWILLSSRRCKIQFDQKYDWQKIITIIKTIEETVSTLFLHLSFLVLSLIHI